MSFLYMRIPLAEQLRPLSLEDVVGQDHLLSSQGFLSRLIAEKKPLSLVFWGPPGCGKTTLARLYAQSFSATFIPLSAVFSGVADLRKIIQDIEAHPLFHKETIIFVDEIHRFNKTQQDAFLPYLEKGTFTLIGATTENPSFSLNNALLSRLRVVVLNSLDASALEQILHQYEKKRQPLPLTEEARTYLIQLSQGDGRYLLNLIENIEPAFTSSKILDIEDILPLLQKRAALFDKKADTHYNLISALHKSVRGSDPDAALYWLSRMLEGGEDPYYLLRRMIRMASEDIGLADPEALKMALSAREAYSILGSPEGELVLAELAVYLALAPKSNAIYTAYHEARDLASKTTHLSPPKTILNAPTSLMKSLEYGKDYLYDHDTPEAFSGQNYFPETLPRTHFYHPVERGFEREMKKRLDFFENLRQKKINKKNN